MSDLKDIIFMSFYLSSLLCKLWFNFKITQNG